MEFHNVGLLPKGLPEIMYQFTPVEYRPYTKVIVISRSIPRGPGGQFHIDDTNMVIYLYPTIISVHTYGQGSFSFRLWHNI